MRHGRSAITVLAGLVLSTAIPSPASAELPRTFASAVRGNDSNSCTLASPCRNVARALTQVSAGGEVVILDSGDYLPFTVDKAVRVQASPGIHAGFTVTADGIVVNAGSGDVVVLAGLRVQGLGGTYGITFNTGQALSVTNCSVSGFPLAGIYSVGSGSLNVEDTTVRDSGAGIVFSPSANTATASMNRVRAEGNGGGGLAVIRGLATIRDSVAVGNESGIIVSNLGGSPASAELHVESCVVSNNVYGITVTNANTRLYLSDSTVADNSGIGIEQQNGSTALSRKNNTIEGNGININGTLGIYSAK